MTSYTLGLGNADRLIVDRSGHSNGPKSRFFPMTIHHLRPHGHPMPASWQDRLRSAQTESEVVQLARDYIAEFSSNEIALLPEHCRPPRIAEGSDITDYAFALVRHHCDDGVGAAYAVHRLSSFFSGATSRLAQILHVRSENEREPGQRRA